MYLLEQLSVQDYQNQEVFFIIGYVTGKRDVVWMPVSFVEQCSSPLTSVPDCQKMQARSTHRILRMTCKRACLHSNLQVLVDIVKAAL